MLVISCMRYSAFFISTTDQTIKFRKPRRVNISIKPARFKIELVKAITLNQITAMAVRHDVSDKEFSAGKAVAGAVLAGGVGAIAGAAMGGKKVSSVLTVSYANELGEACEVVLDCSLAYKVVEKYERYRAATTVHNQPVGSTPQPRIKPANSSLRRWVIIYFTWPYQLLKKLTSR